MQVNNIKEIAVNFLWDFFCVLSIIGIWPRYIEPRTLFTTNIDLKISQLNPDLNGLRILQLTDLHFSRRTSGYFLKKLSRKILKLKPDIILFTGDFICQSRLEDEERFKKFLSALKAPYGVYASLGNHDYEKYVTVNFEGYAHIKEFRRDSFLKWAFKKLFAPPVVPKKLLNEVYHLGLHQGLVDCIADSPLRLLENETLQVSIKGTYLNICALGDDWLGRCKPEKAFKNYAKEFPGIILSHNPDTILSLKDYPGEMMLCGHTHGGQVNLPYFRKQFLAQKDPEFVRGLVQREGKKMYINRGLGSQFIFRWLSPPELLVMTLRSEQ